MATGTTGMSGPTGAGAAKSAATTSFVIEYRATAGLQTVTVDAEDREHAVEAALAQITPPEGGSVEILRTVAMPPPGSGGTTGATGASGPTGA